MWEAAWWGGGGGALAALLLLLLLHTRRRKRPPPPMPRAHRPHQVFVTRVTTVPSTTSNLARDTLALLATPADDNTPQIIVVHNCTQTTIAHSSNTSQPTTSQPQPGTSNRNNTETKTPEFKGIPKLPLPEQWMHKRPFDYIFPPIPRPLAQLNTDLGADLNQESRAKKYSATRSPSLEKDEKSPFVSSAKSVDSDVFGFDPESVRKLSGTEENMMSPKENPEKECPSNLRRYRSVSTRLNMCSVNESPHETQQERAEMQSSPRVLECSSAKEKSSTSKFDFSPKLLDCMTSPRFFTPPEMVSPMFFAEPSPKSVYYDTVRSPKFFPETPRDEATIPQSPKALGDHLNRNGLEKPSSPKVLNAKSSPKIYSYNKENHFTFEHALPGESGARMSPRPRKYGGRNSIERERFTPPADKEVKRYRRHNSCDTNYKTVELNIPKHDDNKVVTETSEDVVDCCAKMESLHIESEKSELLPNPANTAQARRQRLKSISLDSDNAKIIEQNLGLPIAKQMKDQMNEAYKNDVSTSCESMDRHQKTQTPQIDNPMFKFDEETKEQDEPEQKSPDLKKRTLRQSSDTQSFLDMPRFSPKEFEITVTTEEGATIPADCHIKRKMKPNLTIDLSIRDQELEKELIEFEKLYSTSEKVKTPTLKVKSTSLDSSEHVNLSLPQKQTLDAPQNSVSVPNTPKRQLKRVLAQRSKDFVGGKLGFNSIQGNTERRLYMKGQDSGIFLRENHASLMLYQPGTSRMGSRTMGSFDENTTDFETPPEINISGADNRNYPVDSGHTLGSNLLNYKQNLSVSSTNLKTLPEGVPSDNFEPSAEDEKIIKKLHRRNSNQSLLLSTHSLQSSNCSLNSSGASCHNLATVRTSLSNFSLNDYRQKKLSLERRDSNTSLINSEHLTPTTRVICSSNTNISGEGSKNCLLQRRGSNNSLTLNIYSANNLSRHSSNSSLNKEAKLGQKKGLLERRSSNTSLTLNINNSNPQLSVSRGLSISNYNLNGSSCNLSRYNSNHSIDNPPVEPKKGILERRSSNTSLTLNIQPQEPRDLEIDENLIESSLKDLPHRDKHRKSLSTENLIPKSYKNRTRSGNEKGISFGSHDNLWSTSYTTEQEYPQNLTYVCGDQENEIIYAFGRQEDPNFQQPFVKNITTKPLSPQSTSEDFRLYLANMQHLQNASSVLSRQQLRILHEIFQKGFCETKCHSDEDSSEGPHCCKTDPAQDNPQMAIPDAMLSQQCSSYQRSVIRNLHQEFWDMPTNFQEKPIVSGCHPKNRYKTILPNEHSRFILKPDSGSMCEGYINANFIKGHEYTKNCYIATQGPLANTIYDFWLMVYQNCKDHTLQNPDQAPGVQKIVMLTNFMENSRQKCEQYFPLEFHEEVTYDSPEYKETTSFFDEAELLQNSFVIKNVGIMKKTGYTVRKLNVRYRNGKSECSSESDNSITVYHYWFHNWADHTCPKDVNALLNLSLDVLTDAKYDFSETTESQESACESPKSDSKFVFPPLGSKGDKCDGNLDLPHSPVLLGADCNPPTIIHCSAGIGRTGCLIAILNGIKQLTNEQKVDVLGIVCNMRLNRGGMVQNSEQYELIHKVLCLFEQACLGL